VETEGLRGVDVWLAVVAPSWTARGIRRALAAHFDRSLLPRRICLLAALPRGEGGKLRRADLRTAIATAPSRDGAPRDAFHVRCDVPRRAGNADVCTARITVARDAPHFEGHFEGDPVLPAVAQLAEIVAPVARAAWADLGAVTAAPRLKWSALVRPGASLTLELRRSPGGPRVDYVLSEGEQVAASGALVFRTEP
jgi:3-hydroxymyristoyl/3-hydroxydecanoyl-(acyl carrier protein) dehydratase